MSDKNTNIQNRSLVDRIKRRFERFDRTIHRFRQNPVSVLGLGIILALILVAIFAPYIAPYPADAGFGGNPAVHYSHQLEQPSLEHPFGTDQAGRDVLSRVIFGTRLSLGLGFVVLAFAIGIGVPIGLLAGYSNGPISAAMMRLADVFLSFPPLVIALTVSVALKPSLVNAMIAISVVWWPWYARLAHGEVLSVKEETFVEASRGIGASVPRIVLHEILPNIAAPIVTKFSLDMGYAIIIGAGLGFLGLGAQPPTPEWGTIISQGRVYLPDAWWYTVFPGLGIFLAVLGFNFLGDGLRDMLDTEEVN